MAKLSKSGLAISEGITNYAQSDAILAAALLKALTKATEGYYNLARRNAQKKLSQYAKGKDTNRLVNSIHTNLGAVPRSAASEGAGRQRYLAAQAAKGLPYAGLSAKSRRYQFFVYVNEEETREKTMPAGGSYARYQEFGTGKYAGRDWIYPKNPKGVMVWQSDTVAFQRQKRIRQHRPESTILYWAFKGRPYPNTRSLQRTLVARKASIRRSGGFKKITLNETYKYVAKRVKGVPAKHYMRDAAKSPQIKANFNDGCRVAIEEWKKRLKKKNKKP